ncbi:MAG: translation elongation factor Ts, partial [Xanthomonadaceae bacterium]|nr:translation elongation factor Ts [Xanthomonadaceae bacterium]
MEITAAMVKELRERSGAGMMECKKALIQNNGDIDTSIEWLRKQGLAKADKKADRVAAEGRIALAQDGGNGVLVEINSET